MIKLILKVSGIAFLLYVILCGLVFLFQEKIIFHPQKLEKKHQFSFSGDFEEINIKMKDGTVLNNLLFKAKNSNGLIFYLHGNAGNLEGWGDVADVYTGMNYDVFMPDYRGYGKSEGKIENEQQIYDDIQTLYDTIKKRYTENKIIILGYSIGTGPAAKLASENQPEMLILQAPYYNLPDLMRSTFPVLPAFILKYRFETNKYLEKCKMPIVIFHGNNDNVIYYGSSLKLKEKFANIQLITLEKQGHNGMSDNEEYRKKLQKLIK